MTFTVYSAKLATNERFKLMSTNIVEPVNLRMSEILKTRNKLSQLLNEQKQEFGQQNCELLKLKAKYGQKVTAI